MDPRTQAPIRAVKSRLAELYGSRLSGLILFGSRARGHFTAASDADVAIILEQLSGRPFAAKCEVIDATYDLFLDSGIIIQPGRSAKTGSISRKHHPYPHVVRATLREGIRV